MVYYSPELSVETPISDHPGFYPGEPIYYKGGLQAPPIAAMAHYDTIDDRNLTLVSSGISQLKDLTGRGHHTAVQATSGFRPTRDLDVINGLQGATFDGGDKLAAPSSLYSISNGANTIFAVAKRTIDTGTQVIFATENGGGAWRMALFFGSAGEVKYRNDAGTESSAISTGNVTTDFNILRGSYDGVSEVAVSVNGETQITTATGANSGTITSATIGAGVSSLPVTGAIAELLIYDRLLTAGEIALVESYLAAKWTLPYVYPYDVIALMGQSNMVGWDGPVDGTLDATNPIIRQWGRNSPFDNKIILAQDPLDHISAPADTIGLGMTFTKNHIVTMPNRRRALIVPCGQGGTGFSGNNWNPGDTLYEDALTRINDAIASNPGSCLTHMLWHQGEADSALTESQYAVALDAMIADLRSRATGAATVPFICGGTLVGGSSTAAGVTAALIDTPNRNADAYYVDADGLAHDGGNVHFDAPSLRTFGQRYFNKTSEFNTTWIADYTADQQALIRALDLTQTTAFADVAANPIIAWYPIDTDNCTLSGTAITQFLDASGHDNHTDVQATGTLRPELVTKSDSNGKEAARFDGGDRLVLPSALHGLPNGSYTAFIVCKQDVGSTVDRLLSMTATGSTKVLMYYGGTLDTANFYTNLSFDSIAKTGYTPQTNIISYRRDGTTQAISIAGVAESSETTAVDIATIDAAAIGDHPTGAADPLDGDIEEIIILDISATEPQLQAVGGYLADKYGIYHEAATWPSTYTADQQSVMGALVLNQSDAFQDVATNPILGWYKHETAYLTLVSTAITQMLDAGGRGNDSDIQATGTARPNFNSTGLNSLGIAEWDGGDELKLPAVFYDMPNGANTAWAVANRNNTSLTEVILAGLLGASGYRYALFYQGASDSFALRNDNGTDGRVTVSTPTTLAWNIIQASFDGATGQSLAVNNGTAITNSTGGLATDVDNFGISEANLNLNGDTAEIMVLDRKANALQVAALNAYLGTKFAITIS